MSQPLTAQGQILPAPVRGVNFHDPLAAMDPTYATWLLNADADNQYVGNRGGYNIHAALPDSNYEIRGLATYKSSGNDKLFSYGYSAGNNVIYDVTNVGAPVLVHTAAAGGLAEIIDFNFRGRTVFFNQYAATNDNKVYDGSTWANWGVTYGGNAVTPRSGTYYKNRFYISAASDVLFGDVDQVTGAIPTGNKFSVGNIFVYDRDVAWIATFSLSDGLVNQQYLAFGNYSGEVLVYSGDYPNSPTWGLVGRFLIGAPTSYASVIEYQGDAFIMTYTGLVSLKDLFLRGDKDATVDSISKNINPYWTKLVARLGNAIQIQAQPSGVYNKVDKKIYILVRGHYDVADVYTTTKSTMFVYNTNTGAWSMHSITSTINGLYPNNLTYFNGDVYFGCGQYVVKLYKTIFADEILSAPTTYVGYSPDIRGAYQSYGGQNFVTKALSYQPIIEQDLPTFSVQASVDFGARTTGVSSPSGLVSGFNKPICLVGIIGTFFQYILTGNTKSGSTTSLIGLKLYSTNVIYQKGGLL